MSSTSLEVSRTVPAEPARVWRAWTDPAELAGWFWPPRFDTTVGLEPHVGGRYRVASEVAGIAVSGEVVELEPTERFALTWRWDGEDAETRATVELQETSEGTDVVVRHDGFAGPDERDMHVEGWGNCLDRLVARLGSGGPQQG